MHTYINTYIAYICITRAAGKMVYIIYPHLPTTANITKTLHTITGYYIHLLLAVRSKDDNE